MAKTKRPKKEWEKTIKDLTASECTGCLKLIHILQRTLLMQLKKRIELEKNRVQGAGKNGRQETEGR